MTFICGSDEHGVAIAIKAKKEGRTPQEVIDYYDQMIRKAFDTFGISFDNYSRTSREVHHQTAGEIFKQLDEQGQLLVKETEQLYDPEAKAFWPTDLSLEPVQFVKTPKLTATSVSPVEAL